MSDQPENAPGHVTGHVTGHATRHVREWMRRPGYEAMFDALGREEARFVGGCVRDSLLGIAFNDVDVACKHEPQATLARLKAAGIRALPTGIDHGTITALLPDVSPGGDAASAPVWHPVQITSLREDIDTDGRHAQVRFSPSWQADARRRDLTMNALYLSYEGLIYDPLGQGLDDAIDGRVRFVGHPALRIREDYLRLLRYFRFAARFARQPLDGATLDICQALAPGLAQLSGERLQDELLKLLALPSCSAVLAMISERQILSAIWAHDLLLDRAQAALSRFADLGSGPDPLAVLRAWLGDAPAPLAAIAKRLRLSNADNKRLRRAVADLSLDDPQLLYRFGRQAALDSLILAPFENWDIERYQRLESLPTPRFPLQGKDLLAQGLAPGPKIGQRLKACEAWWAQGNFLADRQACLAYALSLPATSLPAT